MMHNLHRNEKLDRKYKFNGTLPAFCYLCGVSVVFARLDLVDKFQIRAVLNSFILDKFQIRAVLNSFILDKFQIRAVLNSMIYWIIPNTRCLKQIY